VRILIVWEDDNFESLGRIMVSRRGALRPMSQPDYPELLFHTARGNGNFVRYAGKTWRNIRAKGLPNNPGAIDHLICVVDADKLSQLLPSTGRLPAAPEDVSDWHKSAETVFVELIRQACRESSMPPDTVHGIALRWAKESVVLAAYDCYASKDKLGIDIERKEVAEFLAKCAPPPEQVKRSMFSNTYRHPVRCIDGLLKSQGLPVLGKGPEYDDVLLALKGEDLGKVCERVPDVDRLVNLVWGLALQRG
jgi:hypothetical protein